MSEAVGGARTALDRQKPLPPVALESERPHARRDPVVRDLDIWGALHLITSGGVFRMNTRAQ